MTRARVVVVGLGPAGPDLITVAAREALDHMAVRFVRTTRHPAAGAFAWTGSFDHRYDSADTFDDVYSAIVDDLVAAAEAHGEVLYAVPGNPRVLERSVDLLVGDPRIEVDVLPAMSFLDLAWVRLGVDPLEEGVRLVDAHRVADRAAGERGPLLVGHCHSRAVLSEVKLAFDEPPEQAVILQRLGLPDEAVTEVAWSELDRSVEPDHLTTVWIPTAAAPVAAELMRFVELVRTLRERCPWDREQTHASLARHAVEEAYEVAEAISRLGPDGAGDPQLEEELGDLLFQVVFHATLGAERGAFTLADVARTVHDKLVHRHPHVFGGVEAGTAGEVVANWEQLKRAEKGRASVMDGIPGDLPALLHAAKVQKKAAAVGVDPGQADGIAGALWSLVADARAAGVDAETALRALSARVADDVRARGL
jgi:tetrapyrrole methylase family protein / MazG family protein